MRQGFFEKEEFERLVSFLHEALKDFVRFAYYSGWRKGEIAKLEWRNIEGDVIRLRPEISKTKDGRVAGTGRGACRDCRAQKGVKIRPQPTGVSS